MNVRLLNLCLAIFWLALGAVLLTEFYTAEQPRFTLARLGLPGVSMGWVALALAVYNLVRWRVLGAAQRQPGAPVSRLARRGRRGPRGDEEYNPEFDFNRPPEPPAPPGERGP